MKTLADRIIDIHFNLKTLENFSDGIKMHNPYNDFYVRQVFEKFSKKYFNDNNPRTLILGINFGRNGGILTGIAFIDPIKLYTNCGIENDLKQVNEQSSQFMYQVIDELGVVEKFYSKYFMSAVCPLGFTKKGSSNNLNYFAIKDNRKLSYIRRWFDDLLTLGIDREKCFCIGKTDNYDFLMKMNKSQGYFKEIIPLGHPAYYMRGKRYREFGLNEFIENLK